MRVIKSMYSEYFDVTALLPHNSPHQETFTTINNVKPYADK